MGDNFLLGDPPRGEFSMRWEVFRGNFKLGQFARILIRNSFYMSCFLFTDLVLHVEMLRIIVRRKFSPGLNSLEDIFVEREIFPWR